MGAKQLLCSRTWLTMLRVGPVFFLINILLEQQKWWILLKTGQCQITTVHWNHCTEPGQFQRKQQMKSGGMGMGCLLTRDHNASLRQGLINLVPAQTVVGIFTILSCFPINWSATILNLPHVRHCLCLLEEADADRDSHRHRKVLVYLP